MSIFSDRLCAGCAAMALPLPAQALTRCEAYYALLADWNTRMDLTPIVEPEEVVDRHFLDSLSLLTQSSLLPEGARLVDIGAGAGFPGLPLAIMRPDLHVTLIDSLRKRMDFCLHVIEALKLPVQAFHVRAETFGQDPAHRAQYDVCVSRAVSSLPVLLELSAPLLRVGGHCIAYKGPRANDELDAGDHAAQILGAQRTGVLPMQIPGRDWQHQLIVYTQKALAPRAYPRKPGTPGKQPLS